MSEWPLIEWLRDRVGAGERLPVGPGDDAAVLLTEPGSQLVVSADAFIEGTHFARGTEPERIGHKVIAAAVSDIAAMGCYPFHSLVTLGLCPGTDAGFVRALGEAMLAAAEKYGAPLAGGDVTSGGPALAISVTVLGETRGLEPVLRSGARPGDRVFVTGELGGSLLGRHLSAPPRVDEGLFLNRQVGGRAMIDLSDGLSTDLNHVARESGVGVVLRQAAIPVSEDARRMEAKDGVPAVRHALDDGEDFELLFTVPPDRTGRLRDTWPFALAVTEIGEVTERDVLLEGADGSRRPLEPGGYEHKWSAR